MIYRVSLSLVALVLLGTGCNTPVIESSSEPIIPTGNVGIELGDTAPEFTLTDFDENAFSLSDYKGSPVMIDFWASWCPFCVNEIPEIQAFHESYPELKVIGIHRTDTEKVENGLKFATDLGVTYLMLQDEVGDVYKEYSGGRPFMPLALFINSDGIISDRLFGPKTEAQLKTALNKLMTQ